MQLSEHFSLEEATFSSTATRLGIDNTPTNAIVDNAKQYAAPGMEKIRLLLHAAIHIDSWIRMPLLNKAVNGSDNSDHMNGTSVDFICPVFGTPQQIVQAIIASGIEFDKCIMEGSWVHISFNPLLRGITLTAHFDKETGKASYTPFSGA